MARQHEAAEPKKVKEEGGHTPLRGSIDGPSGSGIDQHTTKLESPMCDLKQVVSGKVIMSEKREGWRFI